MKLLKYASCTSKGFTEVRVNQDFSSFISQLKLGDWGFVNSFPNDKILDWSKLKALADDKINVNEKLKFGLGRVGNSMEKGENAGYLHFLLFP